MSPLVHYDVTHVYVYMIGNIYSRTRQFTLGYRLLKYNYVTRQLSMPTPSLCTIVCSQVLEHKKLYMPIQNVNPRASLL